MPVGVALDLHGNLSQKIVGNATAIAGFKTYPHVDMYETGDRVGRITLRALKGVAADDGLGQPADAAACDADGDR